MTVPASVWERNQRSILVAAQIWKRTCQYCVAHRAAEALLHGWGVRIDEHKWLDLNTVVVKMGE